MRDNIENLFIELHKHIPSLSTSIKLNDFIRNYLIGKNTSKNVTTINTYYLNDGGRVYLNEENAYHLAQFIQKSILYDDSLLFRRSSFTDDFDVVFGKAIAKLVINNDSDLMLLLNALNTKNESVEYLLNFCVISSIQNQIKDSFTKFTPIYESSLSNEIGYNILATFLNNQKIPKLGEVLKTYFYDLNKSNDFLKELFQSLAFKALTKSLKKYFKGEFVDEITKLIILEHLVKLTHSLKEKPKEYSELHEYHKIFDLDEKLSE